MIILQNAWKTQELLSYLLWNKTPIYVLFPQLRTLNMSYQLDIDRQESSMLSLRNGQQIVVHNLAPNWMNKKNVENIGRFARCFIKWDYDPESLIQLKKFIKILVEIDAPLKVPISLRKSGSVLPSMVSEPPYIKDCLDS
ncbi:hypothetical protein M9H77_35480 [Catharanthus roseus]|uniref:Uncharacterized protein n=1 Tax=Catharanthus roseus TaxID=4058 RepID=A0ACB9ZPE7_CATRO|nr:hypothetical protein M9H77_35480 [Catharanthus roseus]